MSSFHEKVTIDENDKKKYKPNTVLDYNRTKFGVDSLDQMTRNYNVKAPTRRWPVQVFYNILNLAAINAWVLFNSVNRTKLSRREFIIKLLEEIVESVGANKTSSTTTSQTKLTPILKRKLNLDVELPPPPPKVTVYCTSENEKLEKRTACQIRY